MTKNKRFTIKNERTLQDNLSGKTYVFSWKTDAKEICEIMNMFYKENIRIKRKNERLIQWRNNQEKENEKLKQSNQEAIEHILDGIVEMHDGKRDYAEVIFNKAIKLLSGDDKYD